MSSITDDEIGRATSNVAALLARYAHRADDHDYDGWADLFCADAHFQFGQEECRGRPAIRDWLAERLGPLTGFHSIVNVEVDVVEATRLHVTADFAFSTRDRSGWQLSMVGRYDDVVVLDDGRWRFQDHRIIPR